MTPFIKRKLEQYEQRMKNLHSNVKVVSPLYHYTPIFDKLTSILSSKQLWFSNYEDLGDPNEIILAFNTICATIKAHMEGEGGRMYRSFWENVYKIFTEKLISSLSFYVGSFTTQRDSKELWDDSKIGGNKKGYVIGFEPVCFQTNKNPSSQNQEVISVLTDINYDKNFFSKYIGSFIRETQKILSINLNDKELYPEIRNIFISHMISLFPSLLNQDYKDEKEIRLYVVEFKIHVENDPCKIPVNKKVIVNEKEKIIWDFDANTILEMGVGKNVKNFQDKKHEIEALLKNNNYENWDKIEIYRSDCY